MDQILRKFVSDSLAGLADVDVNPTGIGHTSTERQRLTKLSRVVRTMKDRCGFLGITELGRAAQAAEKIADHMLATPSPISPRTAEPLRQAVTEVKRLLHALQPVAEQQPDRLMDLEAGAVLALRPFHGERSSGPGSTPVARALSAICASSRAATM